MRNKLPKDWNIVCWSDVLTIVNGKNQRKVENPNGKYPIYGSGGVMGYSDEFLCNENTTIVGRKGSINNPIYVEEKFWNVDTAFGLYAGNKLNSKYLHYFCLGYDFTKHNKSTTLPSLAKRDLLKISMPLTTVLEQQKIVELLDSFFQKLEAVTKMINQNIVKLERLNMSILDEVFENSIYDKVCLKSVVEKTNQFNPKLNPNQIFTYIDISAVDKSIQKITNPNSFIGKNAPSRAKKQIQKGDILFSTTRPKNKNIAKVENDYKNAVATTGFSVLRATKNIDENYLFHFVISDNIQTQIEPFIRGAQYPAISDKNILETIIPLPKIEQQKKIAEYLDDITEKNSQLIKHYQNKLKSLQDLKKSLLDSAFKGKLRRDGSRKDDISILDNLFPDLDAVSEVANLQQAIIVLKTKQIFGSGRGKVYLQKTSANLKTIKKAAIPYEFKRSNYGEFSWKLSEDLDSNPYLRKVSTEYGEVYEIKKESKKEITQVIKTSEYSGFAKSVNEMLKVYQDDLIEGVTDRVELLNTVIRAISETKSTIGNTIYKFMGDWEIEQKGYKTKADKFNPHETFAMIGLVMRLGWDKKLIN